MRLVPVDPVSPHEVAGRLAAELMEAAASARHAGQDALAAQLDDRAEVLRWQSRAEASAERPDIPV